jgi:electron transfer flavoprotein alpha subunit
VSHGPTIVVCLKQVPRPDAVRFHPKTNRIVREDGDCMCNPVDLRALGHALRLRQSHGGQVVAMTMGPAGARAVLVEALVLGADRAVHLCDRRFAGADTLATARALARAARAEQADLVLLGNLSADGGTNQVGPQVAELGDYAQITEAVAITPDGGRVRAERRHGGPIEMVEADLPAVVTVADGPSPEADVAAALGVPGNDAIKEVTAEDLGGTPRDYGTRGSPTFVKAVRPAAPNTRRPPAGERARARARSGASATGARRELWVLADRDPHGRLRPTSYEALACAASVAEPLGAAIVAVLPGGERATEAADLVSRGADRVLVLAGPGSAEEYSTERHTAALTAAIEQRRPLGVIAAWTPRSCDYVARTAARLGLGLTGDFTTLELEERDGEEPTLMWIKPAASDTVEAPVIAHTDTAIGTLRPGAWPVPAPEPGRVAAVEVEFAVEAPALAATH